MRSLWALVGIIILISHYSIKVATILGTNPVAVLATPFLLSYSKLLRAVIAALFYTLLEYPNNYNVAVWLYDGNIGYHSNERIPLFIGALVCLIVLLPYTLFLIFSQWLQSKSGRCRTVFWVNHYRVLPFLEAYHAPYTDKHYFCLLSMPLGIPVLTSWLLAVSLLYSQLSMLCWEIEFTRLGT